MSQEKPEISQPEDEVSRTESSTCSSSDGQADEFAQRAQRMVGDVIEEVVEEKEVDGKKVRHRGIYLLPNLFTTGALFSGFYAVVAGMNGSFGAAAAAIFVAMILDGLDGRVARLTGTESAFGEQYDSLADMVSFGVAPALVAFSWVLQDLGQFGWVAAFVYVAGAALRLARFNVQAGVTDKRWFTGLPSPSAAAIVAGLVWVMHDLDIEVLGVKILVALIIAGVGILMVSNVRYYSFKDIDLKNRVPFVALLVIVLVLAVIAIDPATMLLLLFVGYGASGLVRAAFRKQVAADPKEQK